MHMQRMADAHKADPGVVELARSIVVGIPNDDAQALAQAVQDWVHANITYRSDPEGIQYLQDVPVTLETEAGNCDCMTILALCLLKALGHECYPLGVIWQGETEATHAVGFDYTADCIIDAVSDDPMGQWPTQAVFSSFVVGYPC